MKNGKYRCTKIKAEKVCAEGKELNAKKTRCVKKKVFKECPEGKERNEKNRCVLKKLTDCPDGLKLNKAKTKCIGAKKAKSKKAASSSSSSSSSSDWLEPYDPVTKKLFVNGEENDPNQEVEWRNSKGEVVDMKADVADAFDELASDKKKKEKSEKMKLKYVPLSPSQGKLMVNNEEFHCVKKESKKESPKKDSPKPDPNVGTFAKPTILVAKKKVKTGGWSWF